MSLLSRLAVRTDRAEPPGQPPLAWREGLCQLGPAFYTRLRPTPLPAPYWIGRSPGAARLLGLREDWFGSNDALAAFSGNHLLPGSEPLASVYGGHQFGLWAGQLGDGRAHLLGETQNGLEIQLKGSGRTPYSRMGDGRAVLRSSIREFLCSEAMHALGIPTTRALCITGSNEPVERETVETAAVVTRVAPSFIRFGHFEYFAAYGQWRELRALADFVIERHYPECRTTARFGGNAYAALLEAVGERTAALIAHWQAAGFCHGVMNTDNMSILGLTLDYGPFQFLDGYDPRHICNHSDVNGRYAYGQQPHVAYWNLRCLAQALLPLIGQPQEALDALAAYRTTFPRELRARMRAKLGLPEAGADAHDGSDGGKVGGDGNNDGDGDDDELIANVLDLLAQEGIDWTIFWRRLADFSATSQEAGEVEALFTDRRAIARWLAAFSRRLGQVDDTRAAALRMGRANPRFVLRNHLAHQAIERAQQGDFSEVHRLLEVLSAPFDAQPHDDAYTAFPPGWAARIQLSCSS